MNWHIKTFEQLTTHELYGILNLRNEVFVVEQDCVYLDTDYLDQACFHIFLEDKDQVVAYARVMDAGVRFNHISLGRVIVDTRYRKQNIGRELLTQTLHCIQTHLGNGAIEINAQSYLINFYRSFGFEIVGESFLEDGIPHIKMIRPSS